ncbi:hypothetical protein, partial [Photobacterium lutimaris]|uniref:hypothetical protein n=1 Tax=Photobacterium lutimaris TaxID=388278 RepID=UPI001B875018
IAPRNGAVVGCSWFASKSYREGKVLKVSVWNQGTLPRSGLVQQTLQDGFATLGSFSLIQLSCLRCNS